MLLLWSAWIGGSVNFQTDHFQVYLARSGLVWLAPCFSKYHSSPYTQEKYYQTPIIREYLVKTSKEFVLTNSADVRELKEDDVMQKNMAPAIFCTLAWS